MNITKFAQATRSKLRFRTAQGLVSTEDLWDMKLTHLDRLAQELKKRIDESGVSQSFIEDTTPTKEQREDSLRFSIVFDIIQVKMKEREIAANALATRQRKQRIDQIIARKQDEKLENMSIEELEELRDGKGTVNQPQEAAQA